MLVKNMLSKKLFVVRENYHDSFCFLSSAIFCFALLLLLLMEVEFVKKFHFNVTMYESEVLVDKNSNLVDPASSHTLVSKIKPCMCKYKHFYTVKLRTAHYISYSLFDNTLLLG